MSSINSTIAGWFGLTTLNPLTIIEIRGEEKGRDLAHKQYHKQHSQELKNLERTKSSLVYSLERMQTREDDLKEDLYALKRHIQELECWISSNKRDCKLGARRKPTLPEKYWKF